MLRDCDSTNGTFVNGDPVKEAWLLPGQTVSLGDVELFVESTEVNVAIPKYEHERPKPPVVLEGGVLLCPRHPQVPVTYKSVSYTHLSTFVYLTRRITLVSEETWPDCSSRPGVWKTRC